MDSATPWGDDKRHWIHPMKTVMSHRKPWEVVDSVMEDSCFPEGYAGAPAYIKLLISLHYSRRRKSFALWITGPGSVGKTGTNFTPGMGSVQADTLGQLPGRPGKILRHPIQPLSVQKSERQLVPKWHRLAQVDRISQGLLRRGQ